MNATIKVFGYPLELVEDGFTPSLAQLSIDELAYAYAEADEEGDVLLMAEIDAEMQARRG